MLEELTAGSSRALAICSKAQENVFTEAATRHLTAIEVHEVRKMESKEKYSSVTPRVFPRQFTV